ncbi:Acidic leucine-rich nuclear phosphoprotein 32 family member A, partial [Trichinella papuae]
LVDFAISVADLFEMDKAKTSQALQIAMKGREPEEMVALCLDNCRNPDIEQLSERFVNLEELSLVNVGLQSLKKFPKLESLKKIDLSDNFIANGLENLLNCPNLKHIQLNGNKINDFEQLECLKELKNLTHLDLFNCGVTDEEGYRQRIFAMIPQLKYVDGVDANDEYEDSDAEYDIEDEEEEEKKKKKTKKEKEKEKKGKKGKKDPGKRNTKLKRVVHFKTGELSQKSLKKNTKKGGGKSKNKSKGKKKPNVPKKPQPSSQPVKGQRKTSNNVVVPPQKKEKNNPFKILQKFIPDELKIEFPSKYSDMNFKDVSLNMLEKEVDIVAVAPEFDPNKVFDFEQTKMDIVESEHVTWLEGQMQLFKAKFRDINTKIKQVERLRRRAVRLYVLLLDRLSWKFDFPISIHILTYFYYY